MSVAGSQERRRTGAPPCIIELYQWSATSTNQSADRRMLPWPHLVRKTAPAHAQLLSDV